VAVAYDSPVDEVVQLLEAACTAQPRVLAEPAPAACLANFGADGLEFTVTYWISDPENGPLKLKSDINRAILQALKAQSIEIPFPQRVVHSVSRA
jgi:small-conductance mechanosensitive channel